MIQNAAVVNPTTLTTGSAARKICEENTETHFAVAEISLMIPILKVAAGGAAKYDAERIGDFGAKAWRYIQQGLLKR